MSTSGPYTDHRVFFHSATDLAEVADRSVDLIVTSPPYPMIGMWDEVFAEQRPEVADAIAAGRGMGAFEAMHGLLDAVWRECRRVLAPGGFLCINIGDATRTVGSSFRLYPNHARVISACSALDLEALPSIVWRKTTNAPNKFMGSGTLPAGAYVTLEHEYVLVFRAGGPRRFAADDRGRRRESAYFWEERNVWFSDQWDLSGVRQSFGAVSPSRDPGRARSGAFPVELAYRLICMYSAYGDTVLDPFLGTGTTTLAAIAAARDSVGFERDPRLAGAIDATVAAGCALAPAAVSLDGQRDLDVPVPAEAPVNARVRRRLDDHRVAMAEYERNRGAPATHHHNRFDMPVVTRQETDIVLYGVRALALSGVGITGVDDGAHDPARVYRASHTAMSS